MIGFPEGIDFEEGENCTNVSQLDYETDFLAEIDVSEFDIDDDVISDYSELIEFAEYDMVCT